MYTIEISNSVLNKSIDAINGAVIGLSRCIEKPYTDEEYTAAMGKISTRVRDLLKVCKLDTNNHRISYIISAVEIRTMRFSKDEVKVLSGSAFRKWFKESLMKERLFVEFKTVNEQKSKAKKPSVKELQNEIRALKAQLAAK